MRRKTNSCSCALQVKKLNKDPRSGVQEQRAHEKNGNKNSVFIEIKKIHIQPQRLPLSLPHLIGN
jgi:hypothetical protein